MRIVIITVVVQVETILANHRDKTNRERTTLKKSKNTQQQPRGRQQPQKHEIPEHN